MVINLSFCVDHIERTVCIRVTEEPDEDFEEGYDVVHGMVGEAGRIRLGGCGEEVEAGLGCEHDGAEVKERDIGWGEGTGVDEETV